MHGLHPPGHSSHDGNESADDVLFLRGYRDRAFEFATAESQPKSEPESKWQFVSGTIALSCRDLPLSQKRIFPLLHRHRRIRSVSRADERVAIE